MSAPDFKDQPVADLPPDAFAYLVTKLETECGVTLKLMGTRPTLTHTESGAFLTKEPGLTILGAWRIAAHMARCMADPKSANDEPAPSRFGHVRRRRGDSADHSR